MPLLESYQRRPIKLKIQIRGKILNRIKGRGEMGLMTHMDQWGLFLLVFTMCYPGNPKEELIRQGRPQLRIGEAKPNLGQ
jgi:hypothetical protein